MRPQDLGIGELFWAIREAIIVADAATHQIVLWNPAAAKIFGYSAEEAESLPTEALIPSHLRDRHRHGMTNYHSTGHGRMIDSHTVLELPALHKAGHEVAIELSLCPLAQTTHGNRYVLGIIRDVTERQQARAELHRAKDEAEDALRKLEAVQRRMDQLLRSLLPNPVADRMLAGQNTIADYHEDVTVLFADIVDFTPFAARSAPTEVIAWLNAIFSAFDYLVEQLGLEKIKTVGDSYMVAGGLPTPREDHATAVADLALEMQAAMARLESGEHGPFQLRIGIHSGPVVAGVIGSWKFLYDLWGDTVNTASRMESHGLPAEIQVSEETYQRIRHTHHLVERGHVEVKGKGEMRTYLLLGRKEPLEIS